MRTRRAVAALSAALLVGGAFSAYAASRRWAKYEREMQSPADDPPDALQESEFAFARLRYRSYNNRGRYMAWGIDANTSERHFITGLRRLTRIDGRSVEHIVDVADDEVYDWPWLYVVSGGDWVLTPEESARLKNYLDRGGFLITDDLHGERQWGVFLEQLLQANPEARIVDLENDAPIFHTVYDLTDRLQVPGYQIVESGRMWEQEGSDTAYWRAILDSKDRVQVGAFLNQDLGDAWEFSDDPAYPEEFASMAYRVGVNYVVYAMTH